MKKFFLFVLAGLLAIAVSVNAAHAQGVTRAEKSAGVVKKEITQSQGTGRAPSGSDLTAYGFKMSNLVIGPKDSTNRYNCSVDIKNNTPKDISSTPYFFRYWSRSSASDAWDGYYGMRTSYAFTTGTKTVLVITMIPDAKQFCVMHVDREYNPIIKCEPAET